MKYSVSSVDGFRDDVSLIGCLSFMQAASKA